MAQKEVKQWITVNGKHIPIFEGESKEDAVKRATNKKVAEEGVKVAKSFRDKYSNQISKDNDEKEKQIKQNEKERKSKEDIARDKETFRKAREHEARVKTKAQAGKQAVRDAKSAIKQYGPSRGMWKDFDKADEVWTRISKAYSSGEISQEDYETAYHTFGSRFFEMRKTRHRKK